MSTFFNWSEEEYAYLPTVPGYLLLALLMVIAFVAILAVKKSNHQKMKAKELAFCAMAMALAMVTSFIKFASLPFGGSITLFSMFFVSIVGYVFGLKIGIMTGVAYGFLQLVTGPYIYHPVQVLFDYPLAFGCLGFSGLFANKKDGLIPGYLIGVFGRYLMHCISGYIFFASSTPEGMSPLIYTISYNATYIIPEAAATAVIMMLPAVSGSIRHIRVLSE